MLVPTHRWRRMRSLIGLGIYVAVCLGGSMALGTPIHAAVVLLAWLVFILVCAFTDRTHSPLWKRIGYILLFWLVTVWPPTLIERFGIRVGNPGFLAMTVIVLLFAMRRSRLFVESEG